MVMLEERNFTRVCRAVLLITLGGLLPGCTVSVSCDFANESGMPFELYLVGEEVKKVGAVRPGETMRLSNWIWRELQIRAGNEVRIYKTPSPPTECIEDEGSGPWYGRVFRAELRPDWKIHLVCASESADYPVHPRPPA